MLSYGNGRAPTGWWGTPLAAAWETARSRCPARERRVDQDLGHGHQQDLYIAVSLSGVAWWHGMNAVFTGATDRNRMV